MRVGAAKIKITPVSGLQMAGSLPECRIASGTKSDLYARSIVLEQGNNVLALVSCDLLFIEKNQTEQICRLVKKSCGISADRIMISASHTHSGPLTTEIFGRKLPAKNRAYVNRMIKLTAQAVLTAYRNMKNASAGLGSGQVTGVGVNSRYRLKDGSIAWHGFKQNEIVSRTGPEDPEVGVIHIKGKDKRTIGLIYNYSCHACTAGSEKYGADYPGLVSEYLEKRLGGTALFLPGACGNIHPVKAWLSPNHEKVMKVNAKKIAGVIQETINIKKMVYRQLEIASVKRKIILPLRNFRRFEENKMLKILRRDNFRNNRQEIIDSYRRELECLRKTKKTRIETVIQVVKIGTCCLLGIPGELFVEFGLAIKKKSPFPYTFIAELANDWVGYIPTAQASRFGGYQTWTAKSSKCAPGAGDILVRNSLKLLRSTQ